MRTLQFLILIGAVVVIAIWLYKTMGGLLVLAAFACIAYTFFKKWKTTRFKG